jgi:hypothetical protein
LFPCVVLSGSEGIEQCKKINYNKKISIFTTEEFKPRGRLIYKTARGEAFTDWMSAEDVVQEKIEIIELYGKNKNCEIFIQYDKWPY